MVSSLYAGSHGFTFQSPPSTHAACDGCASLCRCCIASDACIDMSLGCVNAHGMW